MKLKSLPKEEIEAIKRNKLIYSIIKYNQIDNKDVSDVLRDRYMYAIRLNDGDINESADFDRVRTFLEKEQNKINEIKKHNQPLINIMTENVIQNLMKGINDGASDIEKSGKLFEYVTKTMHYNTDLVDYDIRIPFATEFPICSFDEGVPLSTTYEGLLVTKTGSSSDITNLMAYLGSEFGLNIKSVLCTKMNKETKQPEGYTINSVEIDGEISYMDPTSVITHDGDFQSLCLVTKSDLRKIGIELDIDGTLKEEGHNFQVQYNKTYDIDKTISRERNNHLSSKK